MVFHICLYAKDLGVCGHTFPVNEDNIIQLIARRIQELSQEEVLLFQKGIKDRFVHSYRSSKSLDSVKEATTKRTFYFDPTLVVKQDILDQKGTIIVKAGTSINPLELTSLTQDLLFLDATQAAHLKWAKNNTKKAKWILVRGQPFELEEKENRPIFFDQGGFLITKFNIKCIPARVSQDGLRLKIEEIPVREALCNQS